MLLYFLQMIETEEDRLLFTLLYESHRKQMFWVANQVLRNWALSEEAVQDAFEGVTENMKSLYGRTPEDMKNYLLKAAKNSALNLSKKEKKQEEYYVNADDLPVEDVLLEELSARLEQEAVVSAIMEIDEPYQAALYFYFVLDMEYKEIAATLRRKPATVRQQLFRGKIILKEKLEEVLTVYG